VDIGEVVGCVVGEGLGLGAFELSEEELGVKLGLGLGFAAPGFPCAAASELPSL
jgi:hypothetical protein